MIRLLATATTVAIIMLTLAGCGGNKSDSASGGVPALELSGSPGRGKTVWTKAGCGACHTFSPANARGTVAPDLSKANPTYKLVAKRVTLGYKGMPTFKGLLTDQQIADVAAFASASPQA